MYDDKKDHIVIYEIKIDGILGFGISEDDSTFYFMDTTKTINKLQRMKDSKTLVEVAELYFKDKDRPNFQIEGIQYPDMIFSEKYLIWGSKIFYLFSDMPLQAGILDMEELADLNDDENNNNEDKKSFVQGPYQMKGSNDVSVIFQYGQKYIFKGRSFQKPDSLVSSLVADFEGNVDMTTFLDTGDVFLKVKSRYFIFDNIGEFIDEIEFQDLKEQEEAELKEKQEALEKEAKNEWKKIPEAIEEEGAGIKMGNILGMMGDAVKEDIAAT